MKVTVKKLTELRLADKNIRRHTEKQLKEYVRSVNMFGQIRPLIVDDAGIILAGNGLYEALKRAGKETADCYVMTGLSENDKKKLMLADNRIFELGMTDTSTFEEIIKELDGDIDVPGWDEDLLEPMKAIVKRLLDEGKTIKEIGKQLGMKPEEIFRLSGFTRDEFLDLMTKGHDEFSKAKLIIHVG